MDRNMLLCLYYSANSIKHKKKCSHDQFTKKLVSKFQITPEPNVCSCSSLSVVEILIMHLFWGISFNIFPTIENKWCCQSLTTMKPDDHPHPVLLTYFRHLCDALAVSITVCRWQTCALGFVFVTIEERGLSPNICLHSHNIGDEAQPQPWWRSTATTLVT